LYDTFDSYIGGNFRDVRNLSTMPASTMQFPIQHKYRLL